MTLLGPGAVTGLDARAVIRTDPAAGAIAFESNYLVLAELAQPDLPWLFTPAKPSGNARLRPWLVLIVLDARRHQLQPGVPLPRITVNDVELPELGDAWAWAHAQVTAETPGDAMRALQSPDSATISRLLCPRRLDPETEYIACIVPAVRGGVQAGLGQLAGAPPSLDPAWRAGAGEDVVLPVYYSWMFSTGEGGDFKSLVQRLKGVRPDSITGFGTRTVDVSKPWLSPPQLDDGMTIELDGALGIGEDRPGTLTNEARSTFEARLTKLLNFPANLQPAESGGDPSLAAVAPPIYGARHAGQTTVPDGGWVRELNLDPKRRIAAAFGAQYVQNHQEFLMARAWDQLGAVREANRLRAIAELSATVADRLHVRHIAKLEPSALVSMAAPASTRTAIVEAATVHATIAATPLPAGAATVSFSRIARPLGPLGRRTFKRKRPTVVEQGLAGAVIASRPPQNLDGLTALAPRPEDRALPRTALGATVSRAWTMVTATEEATPVATVLQALRVAAGASAPPGGGAVPGLVQSGTTIRIEPNPEGTPAEVTALARMLRDAMLPSPRIVRRLDDRIQGAPDGGNTTRPIMASPSFPAPLALALLRERLDCLLPGIGHFPNDRITLLTTNPAFVEAFLAGANHEMNRELLWREYPTDQLGTAFRHFWPRPDGLPDIAPMTAWPSNAKLGTNDGDQALDRENMMVLLVRGEVLRRYPFTIVYAAPGKIDGTHLALDTAAQWLAPLFSLPIDASTTAFAYALTPEVTKSNLAAGNAGWYFVFSEPVAGPRFNFDAAPGPDLKFWTDLDWARVPQGRGFAIAGVDIGVTPFAETGADAARWNRDSADMARIAFARPFRVGYHADELLATE
jgi:hypothetical protein